MGQVCNSKEESKEVDLQAKAVVFQAVPIPSAQPIPIERPSVSEQGAQESQLLGPWFLEPGKCESKQITLLTEGYKFKGFVEEGRRHGYAEEDFSAVHAKFKGEYRNGARVKGEYYFPGGIYKGQFQGNSWTAKGVFLYKDGTTLTNLIKNGDVYTAECKYPDGTSYVGQLRYGCREGKGKYLGLGEVYEGSFLAGKRHGQGKLTVGETVYNVVYINGILQSLQQQ